MKIKKNMGTKDRIIRFVLSIALFALAYEAGSWIAFSLGIFVLFESVFSWCIYYQLTGKNTCPVEKA